MKLTLPVFTGFILLCSLSALGSWKAGRASLASVPPQPASDSADGTAEAPAQRPPDPAWAAAASPEFTWPAADPTLLRKALDAPDRTSAAVLAQIMSLPEDSVPLLRDSVLKLRGKAGNTSLMSVLMSRWAEISPFEALEFALTLPPADALTALQAALPVWTRINPTAALTWSLAKYRNGQIPTGIIEALPSVAWQWGRQDLPGALTFMQGLEALVGPSNGPLTAMTEGIGGLALQDELRDQVLTQALDFAAARGDRRAHFEEAVLLHLTTSKPAALAAWMDAHPERRIPENTLRAFLKQWKQRDEPAASQWAENHGVPLSGQ